MVKGHAGVYVLSSLLSCCAFTSCEKCFAEASTDSQNLQICGVYALYTYLCSTGQDISYQQVYEVLSPSKRGNSLLELRDAARRLGLDFEIRKTSPEDRSVMQQGPFIAHMRTERVTKDRFSEPAYDGHFVVVLPPDRWRKPEEIDAVDGANGLIQTYSYSGFPKLWTGYYLVEKQPWITSYWVDLSLVAIVLVLVWYICHLQSLMKLETRVTASNE